MRYRVRMNILKNVAFEQYTSTSRKKNKNQTIKRKYKKRKIKRVSIEPTKTLIIAGLVEHSTLAVYGGTWS